MEVYKSKLDDPRLSGEDKLGIELGLLWIGLVRGMADGRREWDELQAIGSRIPPENEMLSLEYHIVEATHLTLIQNEYRQAQDILEPRCPRAQRILA